MMSLMIWPEVGGGSRAGPGPCHQSLSLWPSSIVGVQLSEAICLRRCTRSLSILQFSISSGPGPDFHSKDLQTQHFERFPGFRNGAFADGCKFDQGMTHDRRVASTDGMPLRVTNLLKTTTNGLDPHVLGPHRN